MATDRVGRGHTGSALRPSGFARAVGVLVSTLEVYCVILMVAMAAIVLAGVWYRYVIQRDRKSVV